MYNGQFNQVLGISIECKEHRECLAISNTLKKQCEAWFFCVHYTESKSARKGNVLTRTLMIYQTSYASDIVIFKEAVRRICFHFSLSDLNQVVFTDMGSEPINDLRQNQ